MEIKPYNVVVLPDVNVYNEVIDWSQRISKVSDTNFILGDKFVPHMTVYQSAYPQRNLNKIKKALKDISSTQKAFEIGFSDFSVLSGSVFLDALKSFSLLNLHNRVVDGLNAFREENLFTEDLERLEDPQFPQSFKDSLLKYGFKAKEMYSPHITLSRLKNNDEVKSIILKLKKSP